MKNLKHIVLLFLSLMVLVSCGSSKPTMTESNSKITTISETVHDTVFIVEKDSSSYKALLECQEGKVVIKNVTQAEPGRKLKSPTVRVDNNLLTVDCEALAEEKLAHYKSTHQIDSTVKIVTNTVEVNVLTFFQELQIWLGRIFILLIIYWIIKLIIKFYKPI